MQFVALALFIIGFIIALIYGIQLLVLAFRTSVLWGLGYLFVPFVALIFVAMHWQESKGPFLKSLIAIPLFVVGALLMPDSAAVAPALP